MASDLQPFSDRLTAAIAERGAPICVGIDPILSMFPLALAGDVDPRGAENAEASLDAIYSFATRVLRVIAPLAPCVKFQSAYFEKYLWEGVEAYYELMEEAGRLGLLVIGDVKRGDIGSTATAYASAHLGHPPVEFSGEAPAWPNAITVNPMLGMDTLAPFVDAARLTGRGLFVLVRTSNPGSAELQDVQLADGRTWSEMLADNVNALAAADGLIGAEGFSVIGAVVGATQPQTMRSLRARLPHSYFLLPGYGAQGATAEMTRAAFTDGRGALVSASRSILYAHRQPEYADRFGDDWERCIEQAIVDMKTDIARVLTG